MRNFLVVALIVMFSSKAYSEVNLRVGALGVFTGNYQLTLDVPISSAWTLGPTGSIVDSKSGGYDVTGYSFGVRGNYYFNKKVFSQGWYFGPSVTFAKVEVDRDYGGSIGKITGDASGVSFTGLFGYQWMWESFNINLGIGPNYVSISELKVTNEQNNYEEDYSGDYTGFGLGAEFTVGWKF